VLHGRFFYLFFSRPNKFKTEENGGVSSLKNSSRDPSTEIVKYVYIETVKNRFILIRFKELKNKDL